MNTPEQRDRGARHGRRRGPGDRMIAVSAQIAAMLVLVAIAGIALAVTVVAIRAALG